MRGYVVFHLPGERAASPAIYSWWETPLLDLLIKAEVCAYANDVDAACATFVDWCHDNLPEPMLSVVSLPGRPWKDDEQWNRFDWYDRLIDDMEHWDPPPYLVDLDNYLITHRGKVLWPEWGETPVRREQPLAGTPFLSGWYGQDLGAHRAGKSTYDCYPLSELPPVSVELAGDFDWLASQRDYERTIATNAERAHKQLDAAIESSPVRLPEQFIRFVRSPHLWPKIRSCTDCELDIDAGVAEIPGGHGWLLRFLSDSQGCLYWNLLLAADGSHQIAATYAYHGFGDAKTQEGRPHVKDTVVCAATFEEFIYRFWLENEIWYALKMNGEMPADGEEYLAHYPVDEDDDDKDEEEDE